MWNKTSKKIYAGKKKTKFSWNRQGIILQTIEWLEAFLDNKSAFCVSESDDSDNDGNYNENIEAFICRCFSK